MLKAIVFIALLSSAIAVPVEETTETQSGVSEQAPARKLFCTPGEYMCTMKTVMQPVCIGFNKFCDGVQDCLMGEDEHNDYCSQKSIIKNLKDEIQELYKELEKPHECNCNETSVTIPPNNGNDNNGDTDNSGHGNGEIDNDFSGTGFMFSINSMTIDNSMVKMFNQNSDNTEKIEPSSAANAKPIKK